MTNELPRSISSTGVVAADVLASMSGLDVLQRIADGRFPAPPIAALLGFRPVVIEKVRGDTRCPPLQPDRLGARWIRRDSTRHLHSLRGPLDAQSGPRPYDGRTQGELRAFTLRRYRRGPRRGQDHPSWPPDRISGGTLDRCKGPAAGTRDEHLLGLAPPPGCGEPGCLTSSTMRAPFRYLERTRP